MKSLKSLGKCCVCGCEGQSVRNIMMIHRAAPEKGTGWGCVVCGLPADGAIAVLCDGCIESEKEPRFVCEGFPAENNRVPIESLTSGDFDHDMSLHTELRK